ncbi:MAG: murein L,D-transpeptidase catalytic domain family protein [Rudaea sp.]
MRHLAFFIVFVCAAATVDDGHAATASHPDLATALSVAAPHADAGVIALAVHALSCAQHADIADNTRTLSVIDYSRPSIQPRLWVFDLARRRLLFEELVAHGRNSGANRARHFSNVPGSLMSSIGVFVTSETYVGHNGYSLRLRGLDPGFNDHAFERDIVMHAARYVNSTLASSLGRLGRSFGCPALRPSIAHQLIDSIRGGSLLVAYYPDKNWLRDSSFVGKCTLPTDAPMVAARNMPDEAP